MPHPRPLFLTLSKVPPTFDGLILVTPVVSGVTGADCDTLSIERRGVGVSLVLVGGAGWGVADIGFLRGRPRFLGCGFLGGVLLSVVLVFSPDELMEGDDDGSGLLVLERIGLSVSVSLSSLSELESSLEDETSTSSSSSTSILAEGERTESFVLA